MYLVGLTGGMGSGKSTVAAELARLGAHVIDADVAAREVVAPGEPALAEIRERFGTDIVGADGSLDRAALAAVVFADDDARADLNAITHPRIGERIGRWLAELGEEQRDGDDPVIAVIDHPLLIETGQADDFPSLVVVIAPVETRIARLEGGRGIDPADARARMASQASDDERRAAATHIVDNSGSLEQLRSQVEAVWLDLVERARAAEDAAR